MAEARRDEVACSFCMEIGRYLTSPRTLPCGHFFCEPCLQSNLESNKIIECPQCRYVINAVTVYMWFSLDGKVFKPHIFRKLKPF